MHYHPTILLALHDERQTRLERRVARQNLQRALHRRHRTRWRRRTVQSAFNRYRRALPTNADAA